MIQVWKCDYCSTSGVSPVMISLHEIDCSFNKANKHCYTCKFSYEMGYELHMPGCEVGADTIIGEEIGDCSKWVYEFLDSDREVKLNDLGI